MLSIRGANFFSSAEQIEERVHVLASKIVGMLAGPTVALYCDTSVKGIELILASMSLGLRIILCPTREPVTVLEPWLNGLDCSLLLTSDNFSLSSEKIDSYCYDALISKNNYNFKKNHQFSTIMRTSGSTGIPKSAWLTETAHQASAKAVIDYFAYDESSCWLLSLPLYHVSGFSILMRALSQGAEVFVPHKGDDIGNIISSFPISHCSLVPTQLRRFIERDISISHCRALIIGGDALGPQLKSQALQRSWPIFETYGMTEMASMIWVNDLSRKKKSGLLPHAQMSFTDEDEILVKGASLCEGYLHNNQLERPFDEQGYFPTKDLGSVDATNQLHIYGRKNNRIISGGENIQAEEIERIIEMHPHVEQCVVLGMPHEEYGARPVAFIKWHATQKNAENLSLWLKERLPSFKHPDIFFDWPSHISTESKKPRQKLAGFMKQSKTRYF